ncbi:MAG: type IV pilus modification protein PilV [Gammaproteobacteria bacterium]|nr:type IV pilus modification protein PilV [Gammaproteobacteria bacterium]
MKRHLLQNPNSGFTLIEVMVSVLVISVGLLGMAGLQTTGIQQSHKSYLKTQASLLAFDMADRMRANLVGVTAGHYDAVNSIDALVETIPDCINAGTPCSAADTASHDAYQWSNAASDFSIPNTLPGGQGMVSLNGTGIFTITVFWDEARTGVTGTNCSNDPQLDMACFILEFLP